MQRALSVAGFRIQLFYSPVHPSAGIWSLVWCESIGLFSNKNYFKIGEHRFERNFSSTSSAYWRGSLQQKDQTNLIHKGVLCSQNRHLFLLHNQFITISTSLINLFSAGGSNEFLAVQQIDLNECLACEWPGHLANDKLQKNWSWLKTFIKHTIRQVRNKTTE